MNSAVRKEALYYLQLPEPPLLELIGQTQQVAAIGKYPSPIERGRDWFEHHEVLLYGRLCLEERFCAKLSESGFGDEVTLLLAIADIICSVLVGVPPFVVSALLVKKGIAGFCHCGRDMETERRRRILRRSVIWHNNLSHDIRREEELGEKAQVNLTKNWQDQRALVCRVISGLYQEQFYDLLKGYDVPIPGSDGTQRTATPAEQGAAADADKPRR